LFHYTNDKGYKAISSQPVWLFKASSPPGNRPKGAYFTSLPPGTINLAKRLFDRGGAGKVEFAFCFSDGSDLKRLRGGRGAVIFYSPQDYPVEKPRQGPHGPVADVEEALK